MFGGFFGGFEPLPGGGHRSAPPSARARRDAHCAPPPRAFVSARRPPLPGPAVAARENRRGSLWARAASSRDSSHPPRRSTASTKRDFASSSARAGREGLPLPSPRGERASACCTGRVADTSIPPRISERRSVCFARVPPEGEGRLRDTHPPRRPAREDRRRHRNPHRAMLAGGRCHPASDSIRRDDLRHCARARRTPRSCGCARPPCRRCRRRDPGGRRRE